MSVARGRVLGTRRTDGQEGKVPEVALACRAPCLPCPPDKGSATGHTALPTRPECFTYQRPLTSLFPPHSPRPHSGACRFQPHGARLQCLLSPLLLSPVGPGLLLSLSHRDGFHSPFRTGVAKVGGRGGLQIHLRHGQNQRQVQEGLSPSTTLRQWKEWGLRRPNPRSLPYPPEAVTPPKD